MLRTFADISGLNIVIDQSVQGAVDVSLHEVPWDQALDIILRDHKLGYSVDGTIVRIAPMTVLADEEAQRRKLAEERALSGELEVLTRPLSYAKAADLTAAADADGAVGARRHSDRCRGPTRSSFAISPSRLQSAGATDRRARPAAAAGRDRSAHRHDDARLRAAISACSGASTAAWRRIWATRRAWRSRTRAASAVGRAARRASTSGR